jgi:hypothetical protein
MRVVILGTLFLTACAADPIMTQPLIEDAPTVQLCEAVYYAQPAVGQRARLEAERRGINCTDYMAAVVQLRQEREAQRAQAAQILLNRPAYQYQPYQVPMPAPIQAPRQTICTTQRFGDQLQTVCR